MNQLYRSALFALLFFLPLWAQAQYTPVTVNGAIAGGEYGTHTDGQNKQDNTYMTWDATNLYIGVASANVAEGAVVYLNTSPSVPVNATNNAAGTLAGFTYDGSGFTALPFNAQYVLYFKNGYQELRTFNGSGGWSAANSSFSQTYVDNGGTSTREIAIPWASIGGLPAAFNWFGYVTSGSGFVYNQVPNTNAPGSIGTTARWERYYTVRSTANGSPINKPFAYESYASNLAASNNSFGSISVYDFTMNSTGLQISRGTTGGNWTISGTLVVNAGSVYFGNTGPFGTTTVANINVLGGLLDMDASTVAMNVSGNVSIIGGTFKLGGVGGNVNIAGNFTRGTSGTFTHNNRTVTFNGTAAQSITNPVAATTFYGLSITNAAADVTANGPMTIAAGGGLTINGSATLTRLNMASGVLTFTAGSVSTVSTGILRTSGGSLSGGTTTTLTFGTSGTYEHNMAGGAVPTATWSTGSTYKHLYGTTNSAPSNLGQTFYNVTYDPISQPVDAGLAIGVQTMVVNGTFTIVSTGASGKYLSLTNGGNLSLVVNNLVMQGGTIYVTSGNVAGNIAIGGNYTQTGGTLYLNKSGQTGSSAITLAGDFSQTSGTLGATGSGTATLTFNKATGSQTYSQAGTITGLTGVNIGTGASTNTLQLLSNIALGAGTGTYTVKAGSSLDFQTYALTGSGTFTTVAGATLISANTAAAGAFQASAAAGSVQATTRTYTAGTHYTFNGASAQQTGSGVTAPGDLNINNASGVTLSASAVASGTVALNNASLMLGAFDLTPTAISGVTTTKYIKTNSTGKLIQTVGAANTTFQVGNSAYNPITLNNTGGTSDSYGIRVVDAAPPAALDATNTVNRYWVVTEGVAGGSDLSVVATYNSGEEGTNYNAGVTPYVGLYNSTSWTQQPASIAGSGPFTASSLADFTPADLATAGTRYFALGKDNGLSIPNLTYTWVGGTSTDWGTAANWSPSAVPSATDNVVVNTAGSPFPLNVNGSRTVTDFTVSGTGTFTAGPTDVLTITGQPLFTSSGASVLDPASTVIYNAAGSQAILPISYGNLNASGGPRVLQSGATTQIAGTFTVGAGPYTSTGSTVQFNGTGAQTIPAINYNNLTISGSRGGATLTLASGTIGIAGSFTYTATIVGSVANTGNTIDYNGTGAQTVAALAFYNNLTISGAHTTNNVTLATGTIIVAGTFSPTATFSSGTYVTTGNTVDFSSAGAQTIPVFNYNSMSSSGNGARTLANGVIGINGTYIPTSGAVTVGTSTVNFTNAGTQTIPATFYYSITNTGNGNRTWDNTGTIDLQNTFTPGTGTHTITGSTVKYSSTAATSFGFTAITTNVPGRWYNNLELVGGTSTTWALTSGQSLGVAGNFVMSGGGLFNLGSAGTGTLTVDGDGTFSGGARLRITTGAGTGSASFGGDLNVTTSGSVVWVAISNSAAAGTLTVTGDYNQTGSGTGSGYVSNGTNAGTLNVGGDMNLSGTTTLVLQNSTGSTGAAVNLTGNLTVSNTARILMEVSSATAGTSLFVCGGNATFTSTTAPFLNFGTGTITNNEFRLGGNFSKSGTGTISQSGTVAAKGIVFNKAGTQTFSYAGTNSSIVSWTVNSGSTLQLSSGLTLGTGTTPRSTFTLNGRLDAGTNVINAANTTDPTFTLGAGGLLNTAVLTGIPGTVTGFGAGNLSLSSAASYGFSGAAAQVTGSFTTTPTAATATGFVINNGSGVTLSTDFNLTDSLVFKAGKLTLGANDLNLSAAATITGASSSKYVVAASTGVLQYLSLPTSTSKLLPVGLASSYTPITVNNQDATAADYAARIASGHSGTVLDATKIVNIEYFLTTTSPSTTVGLQWNSGDQAGSFSPGSPVEIGQKSGGAYQVVAQSLTASGSNPYSVSSTFNTSTGGSYVIGNTTSVGPTPYVWNGSVSGFWGTGANWTPTGVPTSTDYLTISSPGTHTLSISDARSIKNFTLNGTGAIILTSTGSLTINGTVTYGGSATGTFAASSTVAIGSTANQTVPPLNYGNLVLSGGDRTLSSTGTIGIAGTLTPGVGAYTTTGSTVDFNGTSLQTFPAIPYNNLTLSNTAGVNLTGSTTVAGDLTVASGVSVGFGSATYVLDAQGGLSNAGSFTGSGVGKVRLSGSSAQTLSGSGTYRNLEVNNAAGVNSTGFPTINNNLTLLSGKLFSPSDTIMLGSSASLVEGTTAFVRGYIKTTRVVNTAASTFGGIGYELTAGSNIGTVTVLRQSGSPVSGQGSCCAAHQSILRTYKVTPSQQPATANRDVYVKWPAEDDNGQNMAMLQLWKSPDGVAPYSRISTVQDVSGTNPRVAFIDNIPSFSVFTGADDQNFLPLGLLSFTGKPAGQAAELAWTMSQEKLWATFTLERSADGKTFAPIATLRPQANGRAQTAYSYTDRSLAGQAYYRLRLADADGKQELSEQVFVSLKAGCVRTLALFPNPSATGARLAIGGEVEGIEPVTVRILTLEGRLLETLSGTQADLNTRLADRTATLAPGFYQMLVSTSQETVTLKWVKR